MLKQYGTLVRLSDVKDAASSFVKLKEMGFGLCQLVYKPEKYIPEDAKIIKAAAEKTGVKIVSLFAGYNDNFTKWDLYDDFLTSGINSKKYGKRRLSYIKNAASFAKELGVLDVLIHAGFIENNPFSKGYIHMRKCITDFASYCNKIGVNLILETGGESPVTLLRMIEDINLSNIFVNLDTANIIMYGFGNPVEAVYTLKNKIRSIHIKDGTPPTDPKVLGKETPIGEGFVDFKKVFAQLDAIGFNGPLIIEREITGEKQVEDLKNAIDYLNTVVFND